MTEIPMELLRRSFESNFFAPLALTQKIVRKLIDEKRQGKVVFTSSIGGFIVLPSCGGFPTNKNALEAPSGSIKKEFHPFRVQVQKIKSRGYFPFFKQK